MLGDVLGISTNESKLGTRKKLIMVSIFQPRELRHRGVSKWPGLNTYRWQTWANLEVLLRLPALYCLPDMAKARDAHLGGRRK